MICTIFYTVTDRFRRKNKKKRHGSGREWESFFREWTGRDFPPVYSWDWDGKRFIFVGVGRERFENSLPCHPLFQSTLYNRVDLSVALQNIRMTYFLCILCHLHFLECLAVGNKLLANFLF